MRSPQPARLVALTLDTLVRVFVIMAGHFEAKAILESEHLDTKEGREWGERQQLLGSSISVFAFKCPQTGILLPKTHFVAFSTLM